MRLLDLFANARRESREQAELAGLSQRLKLYEDETAEMRHALCQRVLERVVAEYPQAENPRIVQALRGLLLDILGYEEVFATSAALTQRPRATADIWEAIRQASRQLSFFEDKEKVKTVEALLTGLSAALIPEHVPTVTDEEGQTLSAPFYNFFRKPAVAIEAAIGTVCAHPKAKDIFPRLFQQFELNVFSASGMNPARPSSKLPILPTKAKDKAVSELITEYLGHTPLAGYFETQFPFSIPFSARFEHCHVVARRALRPDGGTAPDE